VTVIAPDSVQADALSTAMFVMGADKAIPLALRIPYQRHLYRAWAQRARRPADGRPHRRFGPFVFKMRAFSYRHASLSVKLMATGFLVFAVTGLGVAGLQIYLKTGLTSHGTLVHYRGDETTLRTPMSVGELVDITHAHAFTMPLLALVIGLGFVLTEVSERTKQIVVISLLMGMVFDLGLPWLVRYGPSWTVHLFNVAGLLLVAGLFTGAAVPLYEMWVSR
jgi:hypothetical protein